MADVTAFSDTLVIVQLKNDKCWTNDFSGNADVCILSIVDDSKVILKTETPEKELVPISPMLLYCIEMEWAEEKASIGKEGNSCMLKSRILVKGCCIKSGALGLKALSAGKKEK